MTVSSRFVSAILRGPAPGLKTQGGLLVCCAEDKAADSVSSASIIDWKSGRTQRVVRFTLPGEAVAIDACTDHAVFASEFIAESPMNKPAKHKDTILPLYIRTDAKSLLDVVQQQTPSLTEKRTSIDVTSIRQSVTESGGKLFWVPTTEQKADGLTKISKTLGEGLLRFATHLFRNLKKPKETSCIFSGVVYCW